MDFFPFSSEKINKLKISINQFNHLNTLNDLVFDVFFFELVLILQKDCLDEKD